MHSHEQGFFCLCRNPGLSGYLSGDEQSVMDIRPHFDQHNVRDINGGGAQMDSSKLIPPSASLQQAEEMGYDCGLRGADMVNCHFSLFATKELMEAWSRGKERGEKRAVATNRKGYAMGTVVIMTKRLSRITTAVFVNAKRAGSVVMVEKRNGPHEYQFRRMGSTHLDNGSETFKSVDACLEHVAAEELRTDSTTA